MDMTVLNSPNFGYPERTIGRGAESIHAIVLHIAQGYKAGLDATFMNPQTDVSAHYAVMKDGTIHKYVADRDTAYHAGILNYPDEQLPWIPPHDSSRGMLVNQRTIGIEHEGFFTESLTTPQFNATVELVKSLVAKYNIPVDRDHIVGHYRLNSVDRINCPGPQFPWDELFIALLGEGEETMQSIPVSLDRVWVVAQQLRASGLNTNRKQAEELEAAVVAIKEVTYRDPSQP